MARLYVFGINAKDLLSAVIMTAPATILSPKSWCPKTESRTEGTVHMPPTRSTRTKTS